MTGERFEVEPNTSLRWRPSIPYAGYYLGTVPKLNAAVLLNRSGAIVWDALARQYISMAAISSLEKMTGLSRKEAWAFVSDLVASWRTEGLFGHDTQETTSMRVDPPVDPHWFMDCTISFGATVAHIKVADPELAEACEGILSGVDRCERTPQHVACAWRTDDGSYVYETEGKTLSGLSFLEARAALLGHLFLAASRVPWIASLHSACVSNGCHTLLLTGPSGSGKTTLAAYLRAHGWNQLTDDVTLIGGDLAAHPLPLAASIKDGAARVLERFYPELKSTKRIVLAGRGVRYLALTDRDIDTAPRPVDYLVRVRYAPDTPSSVFRLGKFDALRLALCDGSHVNLEHSAIPSFFEWLENTPVIEMTYKSLADAHAMLKEILG